MSNTKGNRFNKSAFEPDDTFNPGLNRTIDQTIDN